MNNDERKDDLQRPDDNRPGDLPKGNQEPTPKPPADNPGEADPGDVGPVLHVKLPEYDAELDPESPDFNPEKWKEATGKTAEQIQEALKDTLQGFRDKMNLPAGAMLEPVKEDFARFIQESGIFEEIARQIEEMARVILEFDTEKIQKAFTLPIAGIIQGDLIREITETMLAAAIEDYKSLEPFILEELNKAGKDAEALATIYRESIDENGEIRPESPFFEILQRARAERDKEEPRQLPTVQYKGGQKLKVSTDKLTTTFFGIGAPTKKNLAKGLMKGQITFEQLRNAGNAVKYERDGDAELSLFYDFLPDEKTLKKYGIPEDFTDFDFFVMTIIDNLHAEGNDIVTVSKVCKEIGLKDAGGPQVKKVMLSLMKGLSTTVTINITDLKREWGINISGEKESLIISPAIPVMIDADQYNVNGKFSDGCIKITEFSPFYRISAAIKGGRFSTWPKEILQLYQGRRTDRYYSVMRYLLREIGWLKAPHSTRNNKLTYSDLYENTGDRTTRAKQLTEDMLHTLLDDVFIPAGVISEYKAEKRGEPGVILALPEKGKLTGKQADKKKLPPPKKSPK